MADLNSAFGSGGVQKAICTICFEDLKPIIEDLQTLPICGHVFHELCIQQWLEYCPAKKKPTCPVCKQSCSRQSLTRLYFQSSCDSTSSSFSTQGPANADAKTLAEEVRRLEMKLAAMTTSFKNQQAHLKEVDEELSAWKQLVKREEFMKEEIKKEKERNEQLLYMKMEELSMKTIEIDKLQERNLALAKELAALKLATDLNLEEEDMVKLASIGYGSNTQNALDVLKKSLALRNKSYKDLMIQCNILGRSESRTCKKLDKAKEKINTLKIRLQQVEKVLEGKENGILRDMKASSKLKPKQANLSYIEQNVCCPALEDQAARQHATENSNQISSSPLYYEEISHAADWNMDSYNCTDGDNVKLISDSNGHRTPVVECANIRADQNAQPISGLRSYSMQNTEAYAYSIQKEVPCFAVKKEAQVGVSPDCLGANKSTSRWCRQTQSIKSSGDLIVVGADGRGGRIKVLKARDECMGGSVITVGSKKQKCGTKLTSQFNIEHFFEKAQSK